MEEENIEKFRRKLNENCTLTEEDMVEKIVIDVPMPMSYVTIPLIRQLGQLEPIWKRKYKTDFCTKRYSIFKLQGFRKKQKCSKNESAG